MLIPEHVAVLHLDNPGLDTEFLAPDPIWKHPDAGPKRGKAELVEFNVQDVEPDHVARFRPLNLDRSGCAVDKRKGDVRCRQLLSDMTYGAVIDVDRALDD